MNSWAQPEVRRQRSRSEEQGGTAIWWSGAGSPSSRPGGCSAPKDAPAPAEPPPAQPARPPLSRTASAFRAQQVAVSLEITVFLRKCVWPRQIRTFRRHLMQRSGRTAAWRCLHSCVWTGSFAPQQPAAGTRSPEAVLTGKADLSAGAAMTPGTTDRSVPVKQGGCGGYADTGLLGAQGCPPSAPRRRQKCWQKAAAQPAVLLSAPPPAA